MTPLKAIRQKCLDCCCGQSKEVRLCPSTDCPLHSYRFGRGPKREMSDAQRKASAKNLKRAVHAQNCPETQGVNPYKNSSGTKTLGETINKNNPNFSGQKEASGQSAENRYGGMVYG